MYTFLQSLPVLTHWTQILLHCWERFLILIYLALTQSGEALHPVTDIQKNQVACSVWTASLSEEGLLSQKCRLSIFLKFIKSTICCLKQMRSWIPPNEEEITYRIAIRVHFFIPSLLHLATSQLHSSGEEGRMRRLVALPAGPGRRLEMVGSPVWLLRALQSNGSAGKSRRLTRQQDCVCHWTTELTDDRCNIA